MVGVFLRLKLRLLRHRLARSDIVGLLGFILIWVGAVGAGLLLGGGVALGLRLGRLDDDVVRAIVVAMYTVVALVWVVAPLIAASIDDSLEPRRFELLPLTRRQLATGLLVAGAAGPGGAATLLGLGAATMGGLATPVAAAPQLLVVLVATLLFTGTARWLTTLLSDLLRSRRVQEVAGIAIGLLVALPGILSAGLGEGRGVDLGITGITDVLMWLPPGALGWSTFAFGRGQWVLGLALLAYGAVAAAAVVWLLGVAIDRLQTRTVRSTTTRVREVVAGASALYPRFLRLPASPVGAVAAKELRYLRRDVRVRAQLIGSGIALVVIGLGAGRQLIDTPYAPFLAAGVSFLVVASIIPNQFGFDAGSFWGYLTSAGRLAEVLRGKNLGWGLVAAPVTVLTGLVAAVVSGDYTYLAAALAGGLGILLLWMAVGNATSVLGAYPFPETNVFGNRSMSGSALLYSLGGLAVAGALTLPLAAMIAVPTWFGRPGLATLGGLLGLAYAGLVYRLGLRVSGSLLESRALRLLEALDA